MKVKTIIVFIFVTLCLTVNVSAQTTYDIEKEIESNVDIKSFYDALPDEASENIDEMSILVSESHTLSNTIFNTASEIMATTEATQMVKLNEDNQQVEIYTIQKDDVITDIVVMVHEGKRCVIVITSGTIPEDKINDYVNVSM